MLIALALLPLSVVGADPYAKAVVYSLILPGNVGNSQTDTAAALGAPDAVSVSLGGPGASLMLDMGADTPVLDGPGPDLEPTNGFFRLRDAP